MLRHYCLDDRCDAKGEPFVKNLHFVGPSFGMVSDCSLKTSPYSKLFLVLYSERRECYYESDIGNSYNGRANVTASGKPCLPWAESTDIFYIHPQMAKKFESNYCRAYKFGYDSYKSGEGEPLCLVKYPSVQKSCGVPKCGEFF